MTGEAPVRFESVRIANSTGANRVDPGSDRQLLFGGSPCVSIPTGETRYSDPLDFSVAALGSVAESIHFGDAPANVTGHPGSRTTSFLATGDQAATADLAVAGRTDHWYFVTGIDVAAAEPSAAIITLGDSITDGRGSTTNANNRWPDNLARRLKNDGATAALSVLNQGIGGNAVLSGGLGPTARARPERRRLPGHGRRHRSRVVPVGRGACDGPLDVITL